ncbi:hypothetical protein [Bacterioplanoides sp.]|uniref:hypothetical protein n=1 Tax=Bacterioplanoides sp. TaxID=2066072 RepID=UPI003B00E8BE
MANNLIISYDLNSPGQKYQAVADAIKSLGSWAKVQGSVWYVNSSYSASQAGDKVYEQMDHNDSLIVVNASFNDATWWGLSEEVGNHLKRNWHR